MSETTTHLNLPLPRPENVAAEDALRLRAALIALDAAIGGLQMPVDGSETVAGLLRLATTSEASAGAHATAVPSVQRARDMIDTALTDFVGAAPAALNTLAEMAAALANDANFAATITTALAGKASLSHEHDTRYYTEAETDTLLATKAALAHTHSGADITAGTLAFAALAATALATAADIRAATAAKLLTADSIVAADAWVDLGDVAGNVTLDFGAGRNFRMRLTGNVTLQIPTNLKVQSGVIEFEQDGVGTRTVSVVSAWKPTVTYSGIQTGDGKRSVFPYKVRSATASSERILFGVGKDT